MREGESFVTLMPCTGQRISLGINYQAVAPVVGAQWASWSPTDMDFAHFRWSMAAARPFLPSAEARPLIAPSPTHTMLMLEYPPPHPPGARWSVPLVIFRGEWVPPIPSRPSPYPFSTPQ